MENYTTIEKLIELGKIWLGTEVGIALYFMGIPLFFHGLTGELKEGLKQCDFDVFFNVSVMFTIFLIIVYIFFW
jgi:hypothetical protein